jgi:hypothetical protein
MMRFVFNFIFFGLLFYLIWQYFPDAFKTMQEWAGEIVNFCHDLIVQLIDRLSNLKSQRTSS